MEKIQIQVIVEKSLDDVWNFWTNPDHIVKWNQADESWHSPFAESDLKKGGRFLFRMEAKDGSMGFDFSGTYTEVVVKQKIGFQLDDERMVDVTFQKQGSSIVVTESFEPEEQFDLDLQRKGWQAILENFKKYSEFQ